MSHFIEKMSKNLIKPTFIETISHIAQKQQKHVVYMLNNETSEINIHFKALSTH